MRRRTLGFISLLPAIVSAQAPRPRLSADVRQYVTVDAPVVALTHVKVIDGTGAAARDDQTIIVADGKIRSVGDAATAQVPADARVMDLRGYSVMPGFVMVHEHMFYPAGQMPIYPEQGFSFPRMYLGGGATTIRTGGSMEPYTDLNLRKWIDNGIIPGPKMDVTGPYLQGPGMGLYQVHELTGPDDARKVVAFWAEQGVTSFKAYMAIRRDELRAAVEEAHKRGLKVTGHLCSVTLGEAADIGIDDLEHGLVVASDFDANKKPDECPIATQSPSIAALDVTSAPVQALIRKLVENKVALTSTLTVFETFTPRRPVVSSKVLDAMTQDARLSFLRSRASVADNPDSPWMKLFPKEMAFEKMFFDAGGLLVCGTDPTGFGGVVAGYANQRQLQLLVEAGLTPLQAIKVATLNGATYLGRADRVGSIAAGKDADLLVIKGDPTARIADIEKLETVFKDGVGYDSQKLLLSGRGSVGLK